MLNITNIFFTIKAHVVVTGTLLTGRVSNCNESEVTGISFRNVSNFQNVQVTGTSIKEVVSNSYVAQVTAIGSNLQNVKITDTSNEEVVLNLHQASMTAFIGSRFENYATPLRLRGGAKKSKKKLSLIQNLKKIKTASDDNSDKTSVKSVDASVLQMKKMKQISADALRLKHKRVAETTEETVVRNKKKEQIRKSGTIVCILMKRKSIYNIKIKWFRRK